MVARSYILTIGRALSDIRRLHRILIDAPGNKSGSIKKLVKSHDLLVPLDSRITAFTSVAYQPSHLLGVLRGLRPGYLILKWVSHLDAFSAYPIRTWLPCVCHWRDNRYTVGPFTAVLSY